MNGKKLWALTVVVWSCVLLATNVHGQCLTHSPTEYGKNLLADMIKNPPHRWYGTTMVFRVQNTVRYWYGSDITHAVSVWNNSSYKGTSTAFLFDDDGDTNAATDYPDLNNVVGIKNMPSHIAAQAHTYFYGNGEIYECDMNINSISVLNIQPHSLAGANDLCVRNALCHEFGHALGLSHMDKNSVGS